jgi:hypothetical protein
MKFALVNSQRQEAESQLKGVCIGCGYPVVAKCGERRIHHWAHKGRVKCDPWWEKETAWHRSWKNQFPEDWQEIVHLADDGEKHVADVKTQDGWVIEFQHSYIAPEERRSRESFYKKLIWVVDGDRRARDKTRFMHVIKQSGPNNLWPQLRVTFAEGAIFRDWIASTVHVIYDFGVDDLWCLFPQSNELWAYILPIPRMEFIERLRSSSLSPFDDVVRKFKLFLDNYKSPRHLVQGL